MPNRLKSGSKYQNVISKVVFTLKQDPNGRWFLESKMGKGEACNETEMVKFLNYSRFERLLV
jgi:hypothetical protein